MGGYGYYGGYYYSSYLIYMLPAILISLWAQIKVKSAFSKYSKVFSSLSGAEAAERVLRLNGVTGVQIERVSGNLTDHFDPRTNVIRLSESVYDSRTVAAVGVAAHEAGHAVQHAVGYWPNKARTAILPVCRIGSGLSWPLILIGIVLSMRPLVLTGILFFCATLLFQLVTLPVELNASGRAMQTIRDGNLLTSDAEIRGARKVLNAAAMTYVAAVITSLLQLLRLLSLANRKR